MSLADRAPWTIRRVLDWTRDEFLRRKIESARLDAEVLLGKALGLSRMQLYLDMDRPLSTSELAVYRALVKRRTTHEPVSQIVGEREFWSRPFRVTADTLTPRPETELVVEHVLAMLRAFPQEGRLRILDVGTGTGCLAVTLALELPDADVTAVDVSGAALKVACENAARLGAAVRFLHSDMDAQLSPEEVFDVVVSNPPYLAEADWVQAQPEVRLHEPKVALLGGDDDGLGFHRQLAARVWPRTRRMLLAELGWCQGPAALHLWREAVSSAAEATVLKDWERRDRVVVVKRSR
jgi:release factor glutamine methyltransferase